MFYFLQILFDFVFDGGAVVFSRGVAQGNNRKINKGADSGFPQMLLLPGSGQRKISGEFSDFPHGRNLFAKASYLAILVDFPGFSGTFLRVKLVEMNWSPSARQLRQFGCVCLFALPLLGWIWSGNRQTIVWLLGVGAGLAVTGFFMPKALKPVFVGLMLIALPIGMVVTECLLLLIYFGLFLPIGLCFKIAKRDALQRFFEKSRKSYWEEKRIPKRATSYYRQW